MMIKLNWCIFELRMINYRKNTIHFGIKKNVLILKEIIENRNKSSDDGTTAFYDKQIPKVGCSYNCLVVISWDSALKEDKNYYH